MQSTFKILRTLILDHQDLKYQTKAINNTSIPLKIRVSNLKNFCSSLTLNCDLENHVIGTFMRSRVEDGFQLLASITDNNHEKIFLLIDELNKMNFSPLRWCLETKKLTRLLNEHF
jgi:S-adenosylmethionine synthetase